MTILIEEGQFVHGKILGFGRDISYQNESPEAKLKYKIGFQQDRQLYGYGKHNWEDEKNKPQTGWFVTEKIKNAEGKNIPDPMCAGTYKSLPNIAKKDKWYGTESICAQELDLSDCFEIKDLDQ